ncbi:beta-ketoacyl-ACP synthase III [Legionella brunensis]|uniref:Beta-ketoacyl-[acyl-carrier-protein] synthase III n=1 Tax=Legionella brunensis TaxID=29422 RepID=A0A0W0S0M5_9GAMM|nr:beta-ketoacyl-ACP synthase III [Legionella brunensis]KTC76794.1 3-oxoacyl-ACP synthase [Legionella brunensis]
MGVIKVLSCGGYLPKRIIANKELELELDTSDAWITQMTGIKQRHILADDEDFIDCSYQAALTAITHANISPQQINLIVMATTTPYQVMPSSAVMLQQRLNIHHCIAFDMQAACAGFLYGLANAYYLMQANPELEYALVLGCDAFSKIINHRDRATGILFGDGFGAFLLKRTTNNEKGIFYCKLGADGAGVQDLYIPWGVGQGAQTISKNEPYVKMNGKQVFKNAVTRFNNEIKRALECTQLTIADIQHIIPHQANIRILQTVASAVEMPIEKFIISLDKHGNTSAASIPLAFNKAYQEGKIKRGDIILLCGFGAGYTWGTAIFEF